MRNHLKVYITPFYYISLILTFIPNANSENCHPSHKKNVGNVPNSKLIEKAHQQPTNVISNELATNKSLLVTKNLAQPNIDIKDDNKPNFASQSIKVECQSRDVELFAKLLKNNPPVKDNSALLISLLALIVSIGGFIYNYHKDNKSRLRSINDDFWIRKIISPVTIEPLVKEILDIVANLPDDSGNKSMLPETYKQFAEKYHPKIQQLSSNLQALKLLNPTIYSDSDKALSSIEDIMLEYCGSNANQLITPIPNPINLKTETRDLIIENMLSILGSFKEYQTKKV